MATIKERRICKLCGGPKHERSRRCKNCYTKNNRHSNYSKNKKK